MVFRMLWRGLDGGRRPAPPDRGSGSPVSSGTPGTGPTPVRSRLLGACIPKNSSLGRKWGAGWVKESLGRRLAATEAPFAAWGRGSVRPPGRSLILGALANSAASEKRRVHDVGWCVGFGRVRARGRRWRSWRAGRGRWSRRSGRRAPGSPRGTGSWSCPAGKARCTAAPPRSGRSREGRSMAWKIIRADEEALATWRGK